MAQLIYKTTKNLITKHQLHAIEYKQNSAEIAQILKQKHICLVKLTQTDPQSTILKHIANYISDVNDENHENMYIHISDIQVNHSETVEYNESNGFNAPSRSDNDKALPFHSDACFQEIPPKYLGLHYLSVDQFNGGLNQFLSINDIQKYLTSTDIYYLMNSQFQIKIPKQYQNDYDKPYIFASILAKQFIRYRRDLFCIQSIKCRKQLNALYSLEKTIAQLEKKCNSG
eukprot:43904_1